MKWLLFTVAVTLIFVIECEGIRRHWRTSNFGVCRLKPETGTCRASYTRWYYDAEAKECKTFVWGGCGGNLNKFWTKMGCENKCHVAGNDTSAEVTRRHFCPRFRCKKYCQWGFMENERGCKICACNPDPNAGPCPEIECPDNKRCQYGYRKDEKGCTTCECQCPLAICRMHCEHGFQTDEHGCPQCKCRDQPVSCDGATCLMECPWGRKKDPNSGCEKCECNTKEEVCGSVACRMECPDGFMKDRRGCDICRCKAAVSHRTNCIRNLMHCTNDCAFGRAKDAAGCPTCACNPRPVQPTHAPVSVDCSAGGPVVECRKFCEHGFKKDNKSGCATCECADAPLSPQHLPAGIAQVSSSCTPLVCKKSCAFGYAVDDNGCEICVCQTARRRQHRRGGRHQSSCGGISATCRMHCEHGFARDNNGCEECRCAEPAATVLSAAASAASASSAGAANCAGRPTCRMYCHYGFLKGEDGCEICQCRTSPIAKPK